MRRGGRLRGRRGTTAIEYALLAGLVACGLGVALLQLGPPVYRIFGYVESALRFVGAAAVNAGAPLPPAGGSGPTTQGGSGGSGSGGSGGGSGGGGTSSF